MDGTTNFNARHYERLVSEPEAIDFLGLGDRPNPKGALRWLMRTRKLAHVKLARGIVGFRRDDLAAFVERHRVPSSEERPRKTLTAP